MLALYVSQHVQLEERPALGGVDDGHIDASLPAIGEVRSIGVEKGVTKQNTRVPKVGTGDSFQGLQGLQQDTHTSRRSRSRSESRVPTEAPTSRRPSEEREGAPAEFAWGT